MDRQFPFRPTPMPNCNQRSQDFVADWLKDFSIDIEVVKIIVFEKACSQAADPVVAQKGWQRDWQVLDMEHFMNSWTSRKVGHKEDVFRMRGKQLLDLRNYRVQKMPVKAPRRN